ncbi:D-allose transporter substrate-binding protein [Rhizobium sp. BK060]|uniref:D-allose transporter substrate-binding protein n=1 Tax=Rhizobium sp. BK060 TaxID=2587096 RepID=UPI0017B6FAD4|nr:D-allose transporter substrate-binding protein [Rhizobium sp. BK060]MBB3398805.1 D-allose transport system substrate-binding protein [Rhizobium sp. BK060]
MKHSKVMLAAAALAASVVFGAQAQAADYAVILKTLANPFWQSVEKGAKTKAAELGVEVDVFASPNEEDTQAQLQLFEDVSTRGYKGVVFAPISPVNLVQPAATAYKSGIALVNIGEQIDVAGLKQAGGNIEAFVTTDNKTIGKKGADFIIDKLGSAGGEVAIVEGKPGVSSGEERKAGAAETLSAASGVKLVASQPADWDRLKALDVAANILQSSPDLKAFYCANDSMALGVVQAVQNAGRAGQVIVVGTDGVPEALDSVAAGRLTATVAQDPEKMGADGLALVVETAKSGKLIDVGSDAKQVAVDSILVTK